MTHERLMRFARREAFFVAAILSAIWYTKAPDGWQHDVSIWLTVILSAVYLRPRPRRGDKDAHGGADGPARPDQG